MRAIKETGVEYLGQVPDGWEIVPAKSLFAESKEKRHADDERLTPSQKFGVVTQAEYMRLIGGNIVLADKGLDDWKHVEPNDYIISLRSFQGGLEMSRVTGCVTWHYIVLRPRQEIYPDYYKHLFKCDGYIAELNSTCQYLRDGQDLRFSNFVQVPLPIPPIAEQRAIAAYLDKACAEVDRAIEAAETSIEEYLTYKHSITYATVIGGIGKSPLKRTGVEWMSEIPEEWNTIEVGRLAEQIKNSNDGMLETNLLSLSYGTVRRRDINSNEGLLPASFESYNIIEDGDIVLRFTDLQNDQKSLRVGRATERGIITSAYVVIRPNEYESSRYIYYALHSYDLRKGFYGMGAGVRQGLKWQEARYIQIPQPPLEEQIAIADYLDAKCAEIDAAIEAKRNIIDELKAYRKSLVYEYVTGKREVPCQ